MKTTLLYVMALAFLLGGCASEEQEASGWDDAARARLAEEVRAEFWHAWTGYKQHAWGHDGLKPLSNGYYDWYEVPFYMTALDALDTMLLMGLDDEATATQRFLLDSLAFDQDVFVQTFEVTIRLLGGLLSAHQMTGEPRFLDLAENLATRLMPAFESPTGMPYRLVNLETGAVRDSISNPAEVGTLLLEFGTLSTLTGNPVFYRKAKQALVEVYRRRSDIGLVGERINVETGAWTSTTSHIGGLIDSYYEYLLKCWLLFEDEDCKQMWDTSRAAVHRYLAYDAETGFWYGRVDMETGALDAPEFGALDAFFPAVLVLDGDLERARRLQDAAFTMWTAFGVEPERVNYRTMQVVHPAYYLRPENIESAYYLFHATGDPVYLDMGTVYLESLKTHCRTASGYAELESVVTKTKRDRMESFFLAETLKYLYLLFAPPETLDLDAIVFNTEAHPLRKTW